MNFDPKSLERLQELGRKLPQPLPKPREPNAKNKKHIIETENDPDRLFQELINASHDGSIPAHLISRLKEVESKYRTKDAEDSSKPNNKYFKGKKINTKSKEKAEETILYRQFDQLLSDELE